MKMRKLFAGVVAAAIAATTLATAAFADFTYSADSTSTAYSYSITQTFTFAKSNVDALTVGMSGDPMTYNEGGWSHAAANYTLKTVKVNGQDTGSTTPKLVKGLQNTGKTFIGTDVTSFVIEYVYDYDPAVSTEKQDIAKDMGSWARTAPIAVTTADGIITLTEATSEFFSNTGNTTTSTNNTIVFNFKLAEQAAIKNGAVATIKLGFEATTADVEMIKVTVLAANGSTQTVQTAVMKGATSAEMVIPSEYLYDGDYGSFIKSITVGAISSKLTSNVVEFVDGTVVDDTDDTDADEDDTDDVDDVDDADDTDADLDDTDDVDADDTDDTDDTDADNTDADADNTGDSDDTASADGDKNVPTGVALAVVPAAVAAAAAIVAKKRK